MDKIDYIRNHFALGNIIVAEGFAKYLDEIIKNADKLIKAEKEDREKGVYTWVNREALVRDAQAIKKYLEKDS
jgi:hypothetical protein